VATLVLDNDLGLAQGIEDFTVERFIAFAHANLMNSVRLALRNRNIDLLQLGNDLFRVYFFESSPRPNDITLSRITFMAGAHAAPICSCRHQFSLIALENFSAPPKT
jgi:hypothetical protein